MLICSKSCALLARSIGYQHLKNWNEQKSPTGGLMLDLITSARVRLWNSGYNCKESDETEIPQLRSQIEAQLKPDKQIEFKLYQWDGNFVFEKCLTVPTLKDKVTSSKCLNDNKYFGKSYLFMQITWNTTKINWVQFLIHRSVGEYETHKHKMVWM